MAESAAGNVLLFGGVFNPSSGRLHYYPDTWEWNGQWIQHTPAASPRRRRSHAMTFDVRRGRVVLHGGDSQTGPLTVNRFTDTWEWDGTVWIERTPATVPWISLSSSQMAYDGERGRAVLYGPDKLGASVVWEWDGVDWKQRFPVTSPSPRIFHALAYDWLRAKIVLFGGQTAANSHDFDTWEYATTSPASHVTFGAGCAGSAGTPSVRLVTPFERPWIGGTFGLELANLPPGRAAAMLLGASRTRWGSVTLPLDLTPYGMAGCSLHASPELFTPVPNLGGTAAWTLGVPNLPALVGQRFYNQGFVLDPGANRLGVTSSNAGEATVGAR
jgi:hypothetical protein